ncbi:UNVERIFIED_CONTAM: zinc finger protein, partial [Trichonephila clavipes]
REKSEELLTSLKTQSKKILTKEKPYVCEICEKGFSESGNLRRHLRIHTNEKPFVCEICNKSFLTTSALKEHLRIHTKEKPYD